MCPFSGEGSRPVLTEQWSQRACFSRHNAQHDLAANATLLLSTAQHPLPEQLQGSLRSAFVLLYWIAPSNAGSAYDKARPRRAPLLQSRCCSACCGSYSLLTDPSLEICLACFLGASLQSNINLQAFLSTCEKVCLFLRAPSEASVGPSYKIVCDSLQLRRAHKLCIHRAPEAVFSSTAKGP